MKYKRASLAVAMALVFLCGGTLALADDHEVTWKGTYVWERSDKDIPGDIEAVFTPAGDKTWDVVFHFEWEGEMRAWKGTATGSLDNGELKGEAKEDRDRERTFAFEGTVKDGKFQGIHGGMRDGKLSETGKITLQPKG